MKVAIACPGWFIGKIAIRPSHLVQCLKDMYRTSYIKLNLKYISTPFCIVQKTHHSMTFHLRKCCLDTVFETRLIHIK